MKKIPPLLLILLLMKFSGCDLFPTPKEELPPITQEGKNTFGCLVNGKVWLPKGYNGTSNLDASYDPGFMGGAFNLSTYRYYGEGNNDMQIITIYLDSLSDIKNYTLYASQNRGGIFYDLNKCSYANDASVPYKIGSINISNLDKKKMIISGTFEFKLFKPNCDTIKITQGRFDMKF